MTQTKRNLLFIFSDQHAQRITGCYGDQHVKTPALDSLAESGVRFNNAYCPSPICVPSRMAMLTACHPNRQQCWTNDDYLSSDMPTWLHAMGAAGYDPMLIGRLHAMGPDQLHGYATREVGDHSPNWAGAPRHSMGVLEKTNEPTAESLVACGAGQSAYEVKDCDVAAATVLALERIAAVAETERKPFCMTVGLMLPHAPYVADQKWIDYYLDRLPDPSEGPSTEMEHPWINWWKKNRGIDAVDRQQARLARAAYWGLVSTMDQMIGTILETLSATGLQENTLVVYASDHGDHVGERGLWWKHTLYEESTCVPLIMSLPGSLAANTTCDAVVSLLDVSQTLIDALGGTVLPHADGRSFWPLVTEGAGDWANSVVSEYCTDAVPAWTGGQAVQQRMLRLDDWKLHVYQGYPPQLFNLAEDPHELHNLAQSPEYEDQLQKMMDRILHDWNPELIQQTMQRRRDRKDVIAAWGQHVNPVNSYLWPLDASMNRLDK